MDEGRIARYPGSMPIRRPAADWSDEILQAARTQFNGTIRIYKSGQPTKYDPITDTGGGADPILVLGPRPARAQHIRLPLESNDGLGWGTRRRYRFQMEILPDDMDLTGGIIDKGLFVRFEGGKDPALASMAFQVLSAVNSSHAALRTLECMTEGAEAGI